MLHVLAQLDIRKYIFYLSGFCLFFFSLSLLLHLKTFQEIRCKKKETEGIECTNYKVCFITGKEKKQTGFLYKIKR